MEKEWIPLVGAAVAVIGTLSGVLIGSGLTILKDWVQYSRSRKDEQRKLDLARLEDIHILVLGYYSACSEFSVDVIKLSVSTLEQNAYLAEVARVSRTTEVASLKISSLIRLYLPELAQSWNDILDVSKILNGAATLLLAEKNTRTGLAAIHLQTLTEKIEIVRNKCMKFLELLEEKNRKISTEVGR
jgi:hypothetical protein